MEGLVCQADADAIVQVLLNLLDNAVKYSPGHREITVSAFWKDGEIAIDVADKGIGMKKGRYGQNLRTSVFQAENELTRETRGIGIGLAIVKHIVDAHMAGLKSQQGGERKQIFSGFTSMC